MKNFASFRTWNSFQPQELTRKQSFDFLERECFEHLAARIQNQVRTFW